MSDEPSGRIGETGGERIEAALRAQLAGAGRERDQIAKAWLVEVVQGSALAELERLPLAWAAGELPALVGDILAAVGQSERPSLDEDQLLRVRRLAELRAPVASTAQIAREMSTLHTVILAVLRERIGAPRLVGEAAARLAVLFGELNAVVAETLSQTVEGWRDPVTRLADRKIMRARLDQMVDGVKRYNHPFSLVVLDVEGPGTREEPGGSGHDAVLAVVAAALRGSIRLVDEAYRIDDAELCVLAPNQSAAQATQMAHRLSSMLARLEEAGGLRITVSAGVVSCPEHGTDPERLLRAADTAMWRARATGQPVTVGAMQDR